MKISEILKNKKPSVSFEIFPPKEDKPITCIDDTINELCSINPDFISVTYGAGGGTSKNTLQISKNILEKNVTALAHLTCISSTKTEVKNIISELRENNIENVLALRGDRLKDDNMTIERFNYAYELVQELKKDSFFSVGGACYPEGHTECESLEKDMDNLKYKVDCGCEFLITQLFFNNDVFYRFRERAVKKNINTPIICGIMPINNKKQITRIIELSGASIPKKLSDILNNYEGETFQEYAFEFAQTQIADLIKNDVSGIHIYTMNKSEIAKKLKNNLF